MMKFPSCGGCMVLSEVMSVKKNWLKFVIAPLLLLLFVSFPGGKALAGVLDISFSVSAPDTVQPGETYYLTVSYTNNTGGDIDSVVITTDYPAGLSLSHTDSGDAPTTGDDTWSIGAVANGVGDTIGLYLTVADNVASGTKLDNLFTFAYEAGGDAQLPLMKGYPTTVIEGALQVWNFNPLGADPDSQVMYRIVCRNTSDVTAENVVFTYTYPTGFTYNSFGASPAPDDSTDNSWTWNTIGSGSYVYVYVMLDVDAGIAEPATYTSELKVDYECTINKTQIDEQNTSTDATHVTVQNTPVAGVTGVWLASDPGHTGTNYYTGGSFVAATGVITLGSALPSPNEDVLVWYNYTYNKSYTQTLTDSTRVVDGYFQALVDDGTGWNDSIPQQCWSPDSEWIVFQSDRSGDNDIYKIRKDGTDLTQLTTYQDCDSQPGWSPVGDKIVYKRYNGNDADIYVMDADGSNNTQLTTEDDCQLLPVWSPDGTKIAYKDDMGRSSTPNLWVMDADGSNQTALYLADGNQGGQPWQFWSPDSEWVTFTYYEDDYSEIFKVRADGSELTKLVPAPDNCYQVCGFSADGETILYWYYDNYNLYTMDKNGAYGRCILENDDMFNQIHGQKAQWSPPSEPNNKNRWAVLQIGQDGVSGDQIWLVSWDGTYLKQLTSSNMDLYSPTMSPDCSAIVCEEDSEDDLYLISLGSTDTDNEGLKDWEELITGTDPEKADTDGGGERDANEVDNGRDPLDPADDVAVAAAEEVDDSDDKFCFIATAAFGSPLAEEVVVLSKFRDRYLVTNALGRSFVSAYYRFGPDAAEVIKDRPVLKKMVRGGLKVLVAAVKPFVD